MLQEVIVLLLASSTKVPVPVPVRLVGGGTSCEPLRFAVKLVGVGAPDAAVKTKDWEFVAYAAVRFVETGVPPVGVSMAPVMTTWFP